MKNLSKLISACNSVGIKSNVRKVNGRLDMKDYQRRSYIYIHATKCGEIFYIGKGMHIRAFVTHGRSKHWKNKVNSKGLVIFILNSWADEAVALKNEVKVISECKRLGFKLVNISDGGDGSIFSQVKPETRLKQSLAKKGKPMNPNFVKAGKTARSGMKNRPEHTEAMVKDKRKPVINSNGEIYISATHAARAIGGSQGVISSSARTHGKLAYGLAWSYDLTEIPKAIIVPQGKKVVRCDGLVFSSAREATDHLSLELGKKCAHQSITESARSNGKKTAYGYKFYYDFNRETDIEKFNRENQVA